MGGQIKKGYAGASRKATDEEIVAPIGPVDIL